MLEKRNKQKWKATLDPDKPRREVKAKSLDAYDWKQCLSGETLSPSVSLAIISDKAKLKLNCMLKFSPWSANQAIIFNPKKVAKRTYVFIWYPPPQHMFSYAFWWLFPPKRVRILWMPPRLEHLSKKTSMEYQYSDHSYQLSQQKKSEINTADEN